MGVRCLMPPKYTFSLHQPYLELRRARGVILGLKDVLSVLHHVYAERLALVHLRSDGPKKKATTKDESKKYDAKTWRPRFHNPMNVHGNNDPEEVSIPSRSKIHASKNRKTLLYPRLPGADEPPTELLLSQLRKHSQGCEGRTSQPKHRGPCVKRGHVAPPPSSPIPGYDEV